MKILKTILVVTLGVVSISLMSCNKNEVEPQKQQRTLPPPADTDGDGVVDNDDMCPTVFGVVENAGCPLTQPNDGDGDGVNDDVDNCPNEAGPASNDGCPEQQPTDTDGDGVNDDVDNCPNEAGTVANNGCPENNNTETREVTYEVSNNSPQQSERFKRWGDFEIKYYNGVDTVYEYITTDVNNPELSFQTTVDIEVGDKFYIKITESNTNFEGDLTLDVYIDGASEVDVWIQESNLPHVESYNPFITSLTSTALVQ